MTTRKNLSRRTALTGLLACTAFGIANPSLALTKNEAETLIGNIVTDINRIINSGNASTTMYNDFEQVFAKYADVPLIAQKSLGTAWRSANASQRKNYVAAFRGYMARYYGKRFEEFIGATITVKKSRKTSGGFLVDSNIKLKGIPPFKAQWHVIDAKGKTLMYNLFMEGVSVLSDTRLQIGGMLDKRGGNVDKLIAHLKTAT